MRNTHAIATAPTLPHTQPPPHTSAAKMNRRPLCRPPRVPSVSPLQIHLAGSPPSVGQLQDLDRHPAAPRRQDSGLNPSTSSAGHPSRSLAPHTRPPRLALASCLYSFHEPSLPGLGLGGEAHLADDTRSEERLLPPQCGCGPSLSGLALLAAVWGGFGGKGLGFGPEPLPLV